MHMTKMEKKNLKVGVKRLWTHWVGIVQTSLMYSSFRFYEYSCNHYFLEMSTLQLSKAAMWNKVFSHLHLIRKSEDHGTTGLIIMFYENRDTMGVFQREQWLWEGRLITNQFLNYCLIAHKYGNICNVGVESCQYKISWTNVSFSVECFVSKGSVQQDLVSQQNLPMSKLYLMVAKKLPFWGQMDISHCILSSLSLCLSIWGLDLWTLTHHALVLWICLEFAKLYLVSERRLNYHYIEELFY